MGSSGSPSLSALIASCTPLRDALAALNLLAFAVVESELAVSRMGSGS
ncbi:MAG: hypothetical protein GXO32_00075 [Crenarchaeota archaeon]|nr:hypothetical protein [Thermoproteota archaeon]